MKRLSHSDVDKAKRMIANGARMSDAAKALGVTRQALSSALCWQQCQSGVEIEPDPAELVHVRGVAGYAGFDLLPEDARRLHEVRTGNGWYSFHDGYSPDCVLR